MNRRHQSGSAILVACLLVLMQAIATAQSPWRSARPYDGIQAGYDAYRLGEERRRTDIAQQLYLNDQLKYWAGLPTSRGETIYYGNAVPMMPPANLDYTYAYGGWGRRGLVRERAWFGPRTVFEPWPYVPGDIYGYQYYSPMRQPVGQHQEQTGPNRWESHPVYDPPLPAYRPLPPVDSPLLDGTPYETPRPIIEGPTVIPHEPPAESPEVEAPADLPSELPPEPPAKPRRPREY